MIFSKYKQCKLLSQNETYSYRLNILNPLDWMVKSVVMSF